MDSTTTATFTTATLPTTATSSSTTPTNLTLSHDGLNHYDDDCNLTELDKINIKVIGKGAFSKCFLRASGNAAKVLPLKIFKGRNMRSHHKSRIQILENEYQIHAQLQGHKNVVQCYGRYQDDEKMHIVMEYCKGGSLKDLVSKHSNAGLPNHHGKRILRDILEGLIYLHEKRQIIHRDLKIANIFIDENGIAKIGDFGLSVDLKRMSLIERSSIKTHCGTPNYIAPEILNRQFYSFPIDIWSFGVIMFVVLCGRAPFEATSKETTYKNIQRGIYSFSEHEMTTVPQEARDLMQTIFVLDPSQRPSLQQIATSSYFGRR